MSNYQPSSYILRLPEVMLRTGLKHASIYNMMKRGEFPKQRRISPRAVGWDSVEIENWIQARLNNSDSSK